MILVFAFHKSKNSNDVSPFNEIFLKKISLNQKIMVISIRNFSFHRKVLSLEKLERYSLIEISAFLLPDKFSNILLRFINFITAWLIFKYLTSRKLLTEIAGVHQIGFFTPIGYYFSIFFKVPFILQLIGNDKYNIERWKLKLKPRTVITGNASHLLENARKT